MSSVNLWLQKALLLGDFSECLQLIEQFSDYSKRELNRALITFGLSKWKSVDQYRSALMRLAPEIRRDVESVGPTRNLTSLFNLAVIHFHSGNYKTSMHLLDKIEAANTEQETQYLIRPVLRLKAEILLQMSQASRAVQYIDRALKTPEDSLGDPELTTVLNFSRIRASLMLKESKAKELINKYDGQSSKQWQVEICRGHSLCVHEKYTESLECLMRAMRAVPDTIHGFYVGESPCLLVNNAMGCVYGSMGKPNVALSFLYKAVAVANAKDTNRGLLQVSSTAKACLMHNVGVALLHCGQSLKALDCLLAVLQVYSTNPRLWLRLAECCISEQKNGNAYCIERSGRRDLIHTVIGSGPHRKLLIKTSCSIPPNNESTPSGVSGAMPMATMEFACLCVRNCLALLGGRDQESSVSAPPGSSLSALQVHRLRCSALTSLAYIYLCTGELVMACSTAATLLDTPHVSPLHASLGRLYMAEACIQMDRARETENLVDPTLVQDMTLAELPTSASLPNNWFPDSVDNMRAVVCHNLALFHAATGNYKRAMEVLSQIPECRMPIHGIFLALFLQLKIGDFVKARNTLKDTLTDIQ